MWQRHSGTVGKGFRRHHQTPLLGDDVRHMSPADWVGGKASDENKALKENDLLAGKKISKRRE
jgi:hypothetical protein